MSDPPTTDKMDTPSGRLTLRLDISLAPALAESFDRMLAYALQMTELVETDPVTAVHRFRKSLRRTRALLRLLRPSLGEAGYVDFGEVLRRLMRPTSVLRDVDVLIGTCEELEAEGREASVLASVRSVLVAHQQKSLDDRLAVKTLTAATDILPSLATDVRAALEDPADVGRLAAGFDATLRRAEKSGRRARKHRTDDAIHRWRTRIKEVRYQLELLAEPDGGPVESLRASYADLAQHLGTVTDLIALRRYIAAHRKRISTRDALRLDPMLSALIRERFDRMGGVTYDVTRRIENLVSGDVGAPTA